MNNNKSIVKTAVSIAIIASAAITCVCFLCDYTCNGLTLSSFDWYLFVLVIGSLWFGGDKT